MGAEVVVRGDQRDRTVNLQESLPVLVRLFHITVFHFSNALLGGAKGGRERGVAHKTSAAVFVRPIGCFGFPGNLPCKQEGKSSLPVCRARPTMATIAGAQPIRAADIKVLTVLSKEVNP